MPNPPPNATARAVGSDHLDTRTAAHEVVERIVGEGSEGPAPGPETSGEGRFLLVLASFHHRAALGEAIGEIARAIGAARFLGMTVAAVAVEDPAVERPFRTGTAPGPMLGALVIDAPDLDLAPFRWDIPDGPPEHWDPDVARGRFAGWFADREAGRPADGAILFADPFTAPTLGLLGHLASGGPPLVGGLATGASQAGANAVVLDGDARPSGAVGLGWRGPLAIETLCAISARPVGPELVVTRARDGRIEELSGRPAALVTGELFGPLPPGGLGGSAALFLGIALDAAKARHGPGDWRLVPVRGVQPDGSVWCDEPIRPGRTVRFHLPDAAAGERDLALLLDREQLRPPPIAALAFGGEARPPAAIAALLARRLGVPTLAAASAGEIATLDGRPCLERLSVTVGLFRPRPGDATGRP